MANIHLFGGKCQIAMRVITCRITSDRADSIRLCRDAPRQYSEQHPDDVVIRQHPDETFLSNSTPDAY